MSDDKWPRPGWYLFPGRSISGNTYTAKAVTFDGTADLHSDAITCTDSKYFVCSLWVKDVDRSNSPTLWTVDADGAYKNFIGWDYPSPDDFQAVVGTSDGSMYYTAASRDAEADRLADGNWHHVLVAVNTFDHPDTPSVLLYMDGARSVYSYGGPQYSFVPSWNGFSFDLGNDRQFPFTGSVAQVYIGIGQNILDAATPDIIPADKIRLFITSGGKPTDLSAARSLLGTPTFLFDGDKTGFAVNQGNGGAVTLSGSLTNAPTSPSG